MCHGLDDVMRVNRHWKALRDLQLGIMECMIEQMIYYVQENRFVLIVPVRISFKTTLYFCRWFRSDHPLVNSISQLLS
jgi:hypothetical protein